MLLPSFRPPVSFYELQAVLFAAFAGGGEDAVPLFEEAFGRYLPARHTVRVPSARWGLYYILTSMGFDEGDEIILPAFTYFAVPAAVVRAGLKPVFVDISPDDLSIDAALMEGCITARTRAVIPTHLCGFPCDMERIGSVARKHGLRVIEDCAQSLGGQYRGRKLGTFGDAAYFTFGVTKNLTTLGGSMVTTDDDDLAARLESSLEHVRPTAGAVALKESVKACVMSLATSPLFFPAVYAGLRVFSGRNIDIIDALFREKEVPLGSPPVQGRLNRVQSLLGLMQLQALDGKNRAREGYGRILYEALRGVGGVKVPRLRDESVIVFSGCPVFFNNKKKAKKALLSAGIDSSAGYMQDCSRLAAFREFGNDCPNAAAAEESVLYLPAYHQLSLSDAGNVAGLIRKTLQDHETT